MLPSRKYLLLGMLAGLVALGAVFKQEGYVATWRLWNVPTAWPPFMDTRVITDGWEAYRRGIDPMDRNPYDSSGRPMNYPRIWQVLYPLGLDANDHLRFGATCAVLFFLGVLIAAPPLRVGGAVAMLAAVFSPAVMFALERGNTDTVMYFLLALAVVLVRRQAVASALLVLLAFVLKLFPLAGLVLFFARDRRVAMRAAVILLGFAGLYVLFYYNDILRIGQLSGGKTLLSYGTNVFWMRAAEMNSPHVGLLRALARGATAGAMLAAAFYWWRPTASAPVAENLALDGFRLGAALYVGTFLLGNNFDYRLLLLLFVLPQLFEWSTDRASGLAWMSRCTLIAAYGSLWSLLVDRGFAKFAGGVEIANGIAEAAHWSLFALLLGLFVRVLPSWATSHAVRRDLATGRGAPVDAASLAAADGRGGAA